jgi:phytanoyl-CoA dioxygenase PhyH
MTYEDELNRDGFAMIQHSINATTLTRLQQDLDHAAIDRIAKQRAGKTFGLRNLMRIVPSTRELANSAELRSIVEPILGSGARPVRAIYFDKHREANWKVAWHQDLTIAVKQKVALEGFRAWSTKAGITHVQPPVAMLEQMLTMRVHLDDTDESNGALRVLSATHLYGRLEAQQIEELKQQKKTVTCAVARGGILAMRPLLLHSSLPSINPTHRRVLHFEYAALDLPGGLEWFED